VTTANLFIFEYADNHFNPAADSCKLIEAIKPRELS